MLPTKPKRPLQPTQRSTDITPASRGTARRQHSSLTALVLVVPLLLAGCTGSITGASSSSYQPLLHETLVDAGKDGDYSTVLQTSFMMRAGETRRVTDQLQITLQPSLNAEVDNLLICFDQDHNEIERASSGTNYTPQGSAEQWNVSMLITAPAQNPAETYDSRSSSIRTTALTKITRCMCYHPRRARRRLARG